MDLILFSGLSAFGILIVLARTMGIASVCHYGKWIDILLTFGLPFLFVGTFSGMITAFFTGLWFTLMTCLLKPLVKKPTKPHKKFKIFARPDDEFAKYFD